MSKKGLTISKGPPAARFFEPMLKADRFETLTHYHIEFPPGDAPVALPLSQKAA
jgi:hypothetical protein